MSDFKNKTFHELWTKVVGQPCYDKQPWRDLRDRLERAELTHDALEQQRVMTSAVALFIKQSSVVAETPEGPRAA